MAGTGTTTEYRVTVQEVKISDKETRFYWEIEEATLINGTKTFGYPLSEGSYTFGLDTARQAAQTELERVLYNKQNERYTRFTIVPSRAVSE